MKKLILITALLVASVNCAPKISLNDLSGCSTSVSKSGCVAYQIISTLGLFQDAAIGANTQQLLSDDNTRTIVNFVKSSVITVKAAPLGWQITFVTALDELKKALPSDVLTKYQLYINLLQALVIS